ncbi:sigma-70 family RNA polymerase sigma factor [Demequina zhanjiangensis]|uniref:Sigma-70 family RNA polymerase sigma factor n=1 Tax=Demequina zhanjiangensis TaxID=3051659 RepID=A0ABT8FYV5_9MICO|nr:sigma-70 family RNA polymerase sigma factor [Demequina sp. SYSU T00b26]MDN4472080.1 sigma-70 family RNA polymerase sigma factor [Demequina sp. SYSU T00b26]
MLTELMRSAAPRLAAYGYLLTGSQAAGEDLVQDAVVKVFVRRRRLPNVQAAEAYVRAAMRTLHLDRVRREARWRRVAPGLVAAEVGPDHAEALADEDAFRRALASLTAQERTAVVLRYYDDLTVAATAAAMGLADGTVKRYLSNALAKLGERADSLELLGETAAIVSRRTS